MKIKQPLFIVFEGIDGSGKTTQARSLYELCFTHAPCVLLQEPTESKWGVMIRERIKAQSTSSRDELLRLFIKDREYNVEHNINPALYNDSIVILDRYFYSTAAYQACDSIRPQEIIAMNINKKFPIPDRVYFIDTYPKIALERIRKRRRDLDVFEKIATLKQIRENYYSVIDERFCVVDGNENIEEIFRHIKEDFIQQFVR